ncbi:MAG: putative lipid II flippase FtsW [Gammaproteobacteria bacterium]|nr:putative lipid II flippase FtsW [Gammaproteobacteria bacterium]
MSNTLVQGTQPQEGDVKTSPRVDSVLITVYLGLVIFGMIAVYSATIAQAFDTGDHFVYLRKNAINIAIALTGMFVVSFIPPSVLKRLAPLFLIVGIGLLAIVLVPSIGVELNGSNRWVRVGGRIFQPSEFAEILFLIYLARYLAVREEQLNSLSRDVLPIIVIYLVFATLLMLEPDFGSTMVLGAVLLAVLYLGGLKISHIILFTILSTIAVAILIVIEPYRVMRVMSFLNPWEDPYNSGFQLVQSLIALGRGEWFGVGLGTSVQKLHYLPYAGSDFLFAVIGEELGLMGLLTVMGLFVVLIWKIFHISWLAAAVNDTFSNLLAKSIGILIAISAVVNMGVNMGILPTKGLTLPFMSEGGSSLIAYSIAIGIVISIHRESQRKLKQ